MKIDKIIDKIISLVWVIVSTVFTLGTAIIALAVSGIFDEANKITLISICCFIGGISTIIVQLIIFSYQIHSRTTVLDEVKEHIKRGNNIVSHMSFDNLKSEITNRIENNEVNSIRLICYGTSGFGGLIPDLNNKKPDIKVNMLLCSPDSELIIYKEDIPLIKNVIGICKENDKINIVKSLIPPTIRACVLYDKSKAPIWASIQIYYFENDQKHNSFNYQKFYAVVADEERNPRLLKEMDKVIKDEYKRLIKFSSEKQGLNENQTKAVLHCSEENKITKKQYKKIVTSKRNKITEEQYEKIVTEIDNELAELVNKGIFRIEQKKKWVRTTEAYVLV